MKLKPLTLLASPPADMGATHAARLPNVSRPPVEVLLIDAKAAAAVGSASVSWWLARVADGTAPAPRIRRVRMTRWDAAEVKAFWRQFGEQSANSGEAERVGAMAKRASQAAAAARKPQGESASPAAAAAA